MKQKQLRTMAIVLVIMIAIVGTASAHGRPSGRDNRGDSMQTVDSTVLTDATGLTDAELYAALRDGSTLAELIEANGGDVDAVIAELVAEATTELTAKVEAGDITQEQADVMIENMEARITDQVNGTFSAPMDRFNDHDYDAVHSDSMIITDATGLTEDELRNAMMSGSTLAELIEANGGDVDAVIAEMIAEATTELTAKVEAGDITQEQADALIANMEARITDHMNGTSPMPMSPRAGRGHGR
jgi:hypothetical protein